jgi:hypothetical protein
MTLLHLQRVPVQIHATLLIYPAGLFAWDQYGEDASRGLVQAMVLVLVFSSSLLVHEFGHVFAARRWGVASSC